MTKLTKKSYRGIEYINLSSLSSEQAQSIKHSLSDRTLIKILKDDIVIDDCVLYFAYESWYDFVNVAVETAIIDSPAESEINNQSVLVPV